MDGWGASDLFVSAGRVPGVRLHGSVVALEVGATPGAEIERFLGTAVSPPLLARFKDEGDLDVGFTLPDGKRFRLNLARQLGQVSIVARSLPSGELKFEELGLPATVTRLCDRQRGLVLVTGATGAGKSTTLAAMVHHINKSRAVHIVTIEEPIEYLHKDIKARVTQREVGIDTRSFEVGLKQVLRESPDVILIGELRTPEAMRVALQASLTGHLVLSTLHTVDVAQTLQRMVSTFPEHQAGQVALDLSLSLAGIVAQRLVPRKDGKGRAVAIECLEVTPAAAQLIREQKDAELQDLMTSSNDPTIQTFDQSLLKLYQEGVISQEVGQVHASHAEEFMLHVKGMTSGVQGMHHQQSQQPTTHLDMRSLLYTVTERNASDLHLSVGRPPTLRIGGALQPMDLPALSAADVRGLLHSIMSVRQRTTYDIERELDFSLSMESGRRYRVNGYFERGHMAAAMRAINSKIPEPSALGLPPALLQLADQPHGLLLVVGPTGAGKTTTLACLIDRINHNRAAHVITIEDPIEYVHGSDRCTIHQREVNSDTHSFASALKYILRQDPDVVLIGELRDLETTSAALTAAETGHLVLATLHTNDAPQTIDRMIDIFPPHQQLQTRSQLAASLIGVVSQRLLPRADNRGRVAAFEVMVATPAIRTLVRDNKMHQALSVMQSQSGAGMITMDTSIESLVAQGFVTPEQGAMHMVNPANLERVRQRPQRGQ